MTKQKQINEILDAVRLLVTVVKDESVPDEEGNRLIGELLVKLDVLVTRLDHADKTDHMRKKIEIEPPKKG